MFFGDDFSRHMMPAWRWLVVVLTALGLSACANLAMPLAARQPTQSDVLDDFSLEARFSLRHDEKNFTGRLSWRHAGNHDDLLLASPFGQGMARIVGDENGVLLTVGDGKTYAAADAAALTQQVLGFPLPLDKLLEWVRGKRSGGEFDVLDAVGRPLHLREAGWRIDYEYESDDPQALPGRLLSNAMANSSYGCASTNGAFCVIRGPVHDTTRHGMGLAECLSGAGQAESLSTCCWSTC